MTPMMTVLLETGKRKKVKSTPIRSDILLTLKSYKEDNVRYRVVFHDKKSKILI
jgi:hypothetical protein